MQTKTKTKTKAAKNNVRQRVKHRLRTETFLEMDRRWINGEMLKRWRHLFTWMTGSCGRMKLLFDKRKLLVQTGKELKIIRLNIKNGKRIHDF